MIEPFKKLAFHGDDPAMMLQILQDNIEAWTKQFENYPASVLGLDNIRIPRPRYYADEAGTRVTIPGTTASPVKLLINGNLYQSAETIYCDLSKSGAGGLLNGTIAANTPYYLYGHLYKGIPYISASINDPDKGPEGYDHWTYIGACATDSVAATITKFDACGGFYMANDEIETESEAAGGSRDDEEFSSMPVTVKKAWIQLRADNTGAAGEQVFASGDDSGSDCIVATTSSAVHDGFSHGWVIILEEKTIYLTPATNADCDAQLYGWQEDPTEWL